MVSAHSDAESAGSTGWSYELAVPFGAWIQTTSLGTSTFSETGA
jgi:hypothetical protein